MRWERLLSLCGFGIAAWVICATPNQARGDEIWLQNGDRLTGRVLNFTNSSFLLTNEVLGVLLVPRTHVRQVTFGTDTKAVAPAGEAQSAPDIARPKLRSTAKTPSPTLAAPDSLLPLGNDTNLVASVRDQFLKDATPEAHAKFNGMLAGLLTGRLSESDIRAEARSAAAQLRAARKELGDDSDFAIDEYLAILDRFVGSEEPSKTEAKPHAK